MSKVINSEDSPEWGAPKQKNGIQITALNLVWDFQLYVVGLTKDSRNSANIEYTPQAESEWQFDGTGTVTPGLLWIGNASGISVPGGWLGVSDNMITTAPRFNGIFKQMGWV